MSSAYPNLFLCLSYLVLLSTCVYCIDNRTSNSFKFQCSPFLKNNTRCGYCLVDCSMSNTAAVLNDSITWSSSNLTVVGVTSQHPSSKSSICNTTDPLLFLSITFHVSKSLFRCPCSFRHDLWRDKLIPVCGHMVAEFCYFRFNDTLPHGSQPKVPDGCKPFQLPQPNRIYQLSDTCSECIEAGGKCEDNSIVQFDCINVAEKRKLKLILGLAIPTGAIILIVLIVHREREKLSSFILATLQRKTAVESDQTNIEGGAIHSGLPIFSYRELEEATNNFDPTRELGNGGFGTVYHGILRDGRKVAVKRLFEKNYKRIKQFRNEVEILTLLRHPNLVTLYGCTSPQSHELILVYEHITNGTVADHLHGDRAITRSLTWPVRMSIAIETASALSYLHASDIIHRDVKTDNILLDNHFSVKVADFGLSRTFPLYSTHVSTAPQGTPGYLDPEYHQCYQLTDKSDVYSFGVVLIELISSLPAVDMRRHKNEINLSEYAMSRIHQGAFDELIDPDLGFESNDKVKAMAISVAGLAFQCLQHNKEFRPSMAEVLEALMRIESPTTIEPKIAHVNDGASESAKHPLTTSEKDDANLIKNDQPPTTPNCVIQQWDSESTTSTPTTSS
ncbi:hypothetical protein Droror1_Dr00022686 [Drosera rotundifolia]